MDSRISVSTATTLLPTSLSHSFFTIMHIKSSSKKGKEEESEDGGGGFVTYRFCPRHHFPYKPPSLPANEILVIIFRAATILSPFLPSSILIKYGRKEEGREGLNPLWSYFLYILSGKLCAPVMRPEEEEEEEVRRMISRTEEDSSFPLLSVP